MTSKKNNLTKVNITVTAVDYLVANKIIMTIKDVINNNNESHSGPINLKKIRGDFAIKEQVGDSYQYDQVDNIDNVYMHRMMIILKYCKPETCKCIVEQINKIILPKTCVIEFEVINKYG